MPITGFLKIPDIAGESVTTGHEGDIDIHGLEWGVERKTKGARPGRPAGRSVASPLQVHKFYDKSSPYITLAALQGKAFDEIELRVHKEGGGGAHLDYLVITMTNCTLKSYAMFNDGQDDPLTQISERVAITFEKINILYTEQSADQSAAGEHEVDFDIVSGA